MIVKKPRITKAMKKRGANATKKIEKVRIAALRQHKADNNTLAAIEKQNADRPLTDKQRMFVRLWAQGESPRSALVLAGYTENSSRLAWVYMKDPAILKIYRAEKAEYERAAQMTRKRVMDMLQEAYDHAKMVSEPASMVAAAREIGKMCGYYEPEVKIVKHVQGGVFDQMNAMTDEELLQVLEEGEGETILGEARRIVDTPALPSPNGD